MDIESFKNNFTNLVEEIRAEILSKSSPDLEKLLKKIPIRILAGDGSLYGDYHGTPYPDEHPHAAFDYPSTISIYCRSFYGWQNDQKKLRKQLKITLIHEYGHYLGLSEKELKKRGLG